MEKVSNEEIRQSLHFNRSAKVLSALSHNDDGSRSAALLSSHNRASTAMTMHTPMGMATTRGGASTYLEGTQALNPSASVGGVSSTLSPDRHAFAPRMDGGQTTREQPL